MTSLYERRLQLFSQSNHQNLFKGIRHGIEREGLRVLPDATLSQQSHPDSLGKTLTHPYITTDYSEALMEFITPVYSKTEDLMHFLKELHNYACRNLKGEYLWAGSMPARLQGEESIPVARYGSSNSGTMKSVYREGLAHRYGKAMQTIAGIHYNFSMPSEVWQVVYDAEKHEGSLAEFQSESYLALIRNFRRHSWLLMYLFGASPAVSKTFFTKGEINPQLQTLDDDTLYLPWATSLRMSDLGYTNNAQASLNICYNTLGEYVESLSRAIKTPFAAYEDLGIKKDGKYLQLNTNLLQIENEYYSNIRPKRIASSGEKPLTALRKKGVEYIEVRCLDINPFEPLGLSVEDARFMDVFLTWCALKVSHEISEDECKRVTENYVKTVMEGRRPDLMLKDENGEVSIPVWGHRLLDKMLLAARMLDKAYDSNEFTAAVNHQREKLDNAAMTPSAKVLEALRSEKLSYLDLMTRLSKKYSNDFASQPVDEERLAYFAQLAEQSKLDQERLESSDELNFDQFIKNYFESG